MNYIIDKFSKKLTIELKTHFHIMNMPVLSPATFQMKNVYKAAAAMLLQRTDPNFKPIFWITITFNLKLNNDDKEMCDSVANVVSVRSWIFFN